MLTKYKKIVVPICFIIIILCIGLTFHNIKNMENKNVNKDFLSNSALDKTYEIDNFKISNLNIFVKDGISKLSGKVENISNTSKDIQNLYIKVYDKDENVLLDSIVVNDKSVESGQSLIFNISVDTDLTELKTIQFNMD